MKKYFLLLSLFFMTTATYAQIENSAADVIDYREKDGKIIISAMINGKKGDFVLDLSGHCAIMESEIARFGIDANKKAAFRYDRFVCRDYTPKSSALVAYASVGNVVWAMDANFFIIADEAYLKELGVSGTIDASIFQNVIFTIDANRKKITFTAPFKPQYMKLDHRANSDITSGVTITCSVLLDNQGCNLVLDTWNSELVSLTPSDYALFSQGKATAVDGVMSIGFSDNIKADKQFKISNFSFIKTNLTDVIAVENKSLKKSSIGLDLLKNGIVAVDISKGKIYFQPYGLVAIDDSSILPKKVVIENGKLNPITSAYFKENIFDYTNGEKFVSKAKKIVVVDFWATWCGPCMKLIPEMEKLAAKYSDDVIFCKVNADKEKELCNAFSVFALPTLLFIAPGGEPIIELAATPEKIEEKIKELLAQNRK